MSWKRFSARSLGTGYNFQITFALQLIYLGNFVRIEIIGHFRHEIGLESRQQSKPVNFVFTDDCSVQPVWSGNNYLRNGGIKT